MSDEQTPPPAPEPAAPTSAGDVPKDHRTWGMLCHLSALSGYIIPFGMIIGPLVVWMMKKEEMPFVGEQGKEALNFQITVIGAIIVCILLFFLVIPLFLIPVIGICDLVFIIIGAIKANEGTHYRYPFAIRLIK